jgi:hypothetical protein
MGAQRIDEEVQAGRSREQEHRAGRQSAQEAGRGGALVFRGADRRVRHEG